MTTGVGAAGQIETRSRGHLAAARRAAERLEAHPPADPLELLRAVDAMQLTLLNAATEPSLLREVHPDLAVREACEALQREGARLNAELSQSRPIYDALTAADTTRLDARARRALELTVLDMRRAGVALDGPGRRRAQELRERLTGLAQDYGRNLRDDVRTVALEPRALEGLPPDYLAAHPAGPDGKVRVTTDPPDLAPVLSYSRDRAARRALAQASADRAPGNVAVFQELRRTRHELATLLGYPSWAAYNLENKMAATPDTADAFLERVARAAGPIAQRDHATLLAVARADDPGADEVGSWDLPHYVARAKAATLHFDPREVRPYLEYRAVRQAILDLASELFGMTFTKVDDPETWHPSVEHFTVTLDGRPAGRISLDMHPRAGKNKWFYSTDKVSGLAGRQLPHNVLVCNFPDPAAHQGPALMEHQHVVTFFHEFGHLVHGIVRGTAVEWTRLARPAENDFMEAPSRFLEDYIFDLEVLRRFATHVETGEPIPEELVHRLRGARAFGRAIVAEESVRQSWLALRLHDGPPVTDARTLAREAAARFSRFAQLERSNYPVNWEHMSNESYSAAYYTYQWSQVIAEDLASAFTNGLLDLAQARRYRDLVLAPGGNKPAAEAVEEFLGRPYSFDAFERRLAAG